MSQHWYSKDGKACHTQPTKKGAKNAERPTTIRDARKLGLLPSVSGILGVMAKDSLTSWQIDKVIEACWGFPADDETVTLEQYAERVKEAAFAEVRAASDLGTKVHAAIENYLTTGLYEGREILTMPDGRNVEAHELVEPALTALEKLNITPIASEKVLVSPFWGYAGTTDVLFETADGERGVLDFKTKKTREGESIYEPEQHAMQIAAYWQAEWGREYEWVIPPFACGYNVYVSTTEPGRVEVVKHDCKKLQEAWYAFACCLNLWRWQNKYDPRQA